MSILIKGMEMPKSCDECFVRLSLCSTARKIAKSGGPRMWVPTTYRPDDCPLQKIKPHGRLIDADEAKNKIRPWSPEDETNGCTFDTVKKLMHKLLNDTPTVIEAEDGER